MSHAGRVVPNEATIRNPLGDRIQLYEYPLAQLAAANSDIMLDASDWVELLTIGLTNPGDNTTRLRQFFVVQPGPTGAQLLATMDDMRASDLPSKSIYTSLRHSKHNMITKSQSRNGTSVPWNECGKHLQVLA